MVLFNPEWLAWHWWGLEWKSEMVGLPIGTNQYILAWEDATQWKVEKYWGKVDLLNKVQKSETAKKYAVSLPMGLSSYKLVTSPPSSSLPLPLITVSRVITRNVFVHCIFNWRGSLKNYPEQGQCIAKLKLGLRWLQKGRATHFCLPAKGFARRGWRGGSFIRKWRLPSSWASTNYFTDIQ